MAKTLGTILQIASIAVLAVYTAGAGAALASGFSIGAGLSQVTLGISALTGISAGLAGTIGATLALNGLNSLVGGSLPKPEQAETAIKSPRPARVSGYGINRLFMAYVLYVTDPNGTAIDVGVFHHGRVNRILRRYLGDKQVQIDGAGWVQRLPDGQFGNGDRVRIGTTLGPRQNTAFSEVISRVPDQWTADHRGDGQVTGFAYFMPVTSKNFAEVYPQGGPQATPLSLAMELQLVYDWRDPAQDVANPETWKFSENVILHIAHYYLIRKGKQPSLPLTDPGYPAELAAILQAKWNRLFAPTIDYWTEAANDADSPVPLKGVQTILAVDADDGATSITVDSVTGLSSGMTITISATGDTSLTETRTVSGISGTTISFSGGLANDHPQGSQVTWASDPSSPATEPRYRSCLVHKHTDAHKAVIQSLLACCDGWMTTRSDGALIIYSGRYYAPTVTITPDMILSYSLQDGVAEENAVNSVSVTYISANHDFNQVETDPWTDEDDILKRGKVLSQSLDNQVPSHGQARRLTKRAQAKTMAPKRGNLTLNARGRVILGHRYVNLQLVDSGVNFFTGPIEVSKLRRTLQNGGIYLEFIAADPNADAWNPATEEGDPAPVGNRIAPTPLTAPTIIDTVVQLDDSGSNARVLAEVAGPDRTDLTWFMRWRVTSDTSWNEQQFSDVDPGPAVYLLSPLLPVNVSIDLEAAYQTGDGRVSPYSELVAVSTSTSDLAPGAVRGFTVTPGAAGEADAAWVNPTTSNLAASRLWANTANDFDTATQIGSDIPTSGLGAPGSYHATGLAAGSTYFWMTTVSTNGVQGSPVLYGPVTIA